MKIFKSFFAAFLVVELLCWFTPCATLSQRLSPGNIYIDTVAYRYRMAGGEIFTSKVPQLRSELNPIAIDRINKDIRSYFDATAEDINGAGLTSDSLENNSESQMSPGELSAAKSSKNRTENFKIEFFQNNIINMSIQKYEHPVGGRPMYWFESPSYDLTTGNKLSITDFLSAEKEKIITLIAEKGYREEEAEEGRYTRSVIDTVETSVHSLQEQVNELFTPDSTGINCTHFYFNAIDNEVHFRIVSECNGPAWPTAFIYGIRLTELSSYILHPYFKNLFGLWGDDIGSLRGKMPVKADSVMFRDYTIRNAGGYLLPADDKFPGEQFEIGYWNSDSSIFRIFSKWTWRGNLKNGIITDILEIRKADLKENDIIVEQTCMVKKNDPEIIAIAVNENAAYFRKIKRAWRSNRKTGKFGIIRKNKIKKCYSESYGI